MKSDRYLAAAQDMNWNLAGINPFSSDEISNGCGHLESISHTSGLEKAVDGEDRKTKMHKLVNLMRSDLNSGAWKVTLYWA